MQPYELYLAELQQRAGHIPDRGFGRSELLASAAHDAYQATTDRLTGEGWDAEEALIVTRMFGQAVKEWLARNGTDWEALRAELDRRYTDWTKSDRTNAN